MRALLLITFLAIGFLLTPPFILAAAAQEDAEITAAYEAYAAAIEAGDNYKARRFAKQAYELAEAHWGDSRKETAILATNYADQLFNKQLRRRAINIYQRCVEILQMHDDTLEAQVYCIAGAANAHRGNGDIEETRANFLRILSLVVERAEEESWAAGQAGEAYLGLAMLPVEISAGRNTPRGTISSGATGTRIRYREKILDFDPSGKALAEKAIYYLKRGHDQPTIRLAQAHRIAGNYAEADEDFAAAEAHYLAAYKILLSKHGREHPDAIAMDGRVASVRRFTREMPIELEPTRKPSSDRCSVVVRGPLEIEVCPNKRYPPYFPNQALYENQQGFSIMRYDITKEGQTANARIVYSWPGGIFDERALGAARKWTYFPPTDQYGNIVGVTDYETQITYQIGR